jgi:predicted DCC family thiol-disulfide oxidoreductase YuxK
VRRLLSEPAVYLAELALATRRGWNAFFFTPADPTPLGVMRVGFGLLGLWSLFVLGLDLHDYLGSTGWADPALIGESLRTRQPLAWSFWFWVPDALLRPVWLVCLVILGLFSAGLFSRVTAVLSWIIVVSTVRRVPIALFGFDQILSTMTLYLAATFASGQAVSLDRFFGRWSQSRAAARRLKPAGWTEGRKVSPDEPGVPRPTVAANLAIRLVQLHLVFIYAMAGLAKIQGPSWWNGMALWGTMTAGEFVTRDFTSLADWPRLINLMTHASLAFELLYPVLIWVGMLRPLLIAGAVVLHLGIALVAPGLTEFGLAMVAANVSFVSARWLRGLVTGGNQPSLKVLFDGACPRCRASMALVTAADPDRVVEPIDLTSVDVRGIHPALTREACMELMHVVNRDGRLTAGFDAVRSLSAWLPLFWPLAVIGWFPGVAWAGRRVYNHLAATRPRDVPCTDEVCGLRPPIKPVSADARDRHSARSSSPLSSSPEEMKHS